VKFATVSRALRTPTVSRRVATISPHGKRLAEKPVAFFLAIHRSVRRKTRLGSATGFRVLFGLAAGEERLLARADSAGQATVIDSIVIVPEWLTQLYTTTKNFDLLLRSSRGIGRQELRVYNRIKILVVTVLENGFENVLAKIAHTKGNPIRNECRKATPRHVPIWFD